MGSNQPVRGARHAGWLFIAAGIIGLTYDLSTHDRILFDLINLTVGVLAFRLPWGRWPNVATLVLPTVALANLSVSAVSNVGPDGTYGEWFVLVFVWIGFWHRPKATLLMAPVATIAYLAPFASGATGSPASVLIAIPVAVVVGHTIARMQYALARATVTDDLTGLGNRRRANALLDALRPGDTLAILDLDHFKQVNDTLGHQRGDEVLHDFGVFLGDAVRDGDRVARLGGEEFLVVLRGAHESGAAVIERLLDAWRSTQPLVTFSAGLATHELGAMAADTYARADEALYAAKSAGRDRVMLDAAA